jgi:hypothetical protein
MVLGLFKKIKTILIIIVVIVVIIYIIKLLKLKPMFVDMLKRETDIINKHGISFDPKPKDSDKLAQTGNSIWSLLNQITPMSDEEDGSEEKKRNKRKRGKARRANSRISKNKREEACRKIFEDYFDDYFPTCRPKFLKNPETGRPLELDGYNASQNLAFEANGHQHYVYPNAFHKTQEEFDKQVTRDEYKRQRLAELGIDLISINFIEVPESETESYIHAELKRLGK